MKSKFLTLSWLAAAAMTCGLASCSNEDTVVSAGDEYIVLEAEAIAKVEAGTRTDFPVSADGLNFQWSEGDQIVVVSEDGTRNFGVLTLSEGAGESTGTFNGTIMTRTSDTRANIFYLGKKLNTGLGEVNTEQDFNIGSQLPANGNITDYGVMFASTQIERVNGKVNFNFTVKSVLSYARFNFHLPEGVTATDEAITVNGANIFNAFTLSLADASLNNKTEGDIVITPNWTNGDAFMIFVPGADAKTKFAVTIGDKTYKAELDAREYKADMFFCGGQPLHGKDIYFSENGVWTLIYMNGNKECERDTDYNNFGPSVTKTITYEVPDAEANMEFLGWSDTEGGTVKYHAGDAVTMTRPVTEMTVYAVWKKTTSEAGVTAPGSAGVGY